MILNTEVWIECRSLSGKAKLADVLATFNILSEANTLWRWCNTFERVTPQTLSVVYGNKGVDCES